MKRYCPRQHVCEDRERCPRCKLPTKEVGRLDQIPHRYLRTLQAIHTAKNGKEIAHDLGISYETMKVYASHLMTALGCHNRVGLALIWERHLMEIAA